MEQKRFGVKNSRIEELRLFQFALKQKRMSMPFATKAHILCNSEEVEKSVKVSKRRITITPINPPIENYKLPRQPLILMGETEILLRINDIMNITITFGTMQERLRFTQALGDLDPQSSSSESHGSDDCDCDNLLNLFKFRLVKSKKCLSVLMNRPINRMPK